MAVDLTGIDEVITEALGIPPNMVADWLIEILSE